MADDAIEPQGKAVAILSAAERLFTQLGYRRTAMEDIATQAGVAKGTLYLYYQSKEALFCAIQTRNIARANRLCDEAEARGGDLTELLYGQVEAWFGMMFDRYGASDHLIELSAARSSISRHIAGEADRSYETRLARLIVEAQAQGKVDLRPAKLDVAEVVALLLFAARGAKYRLGRPVSQADFHTSLRHITQLFAAAIQIR